MNKKLVIFIGSLLFVSNFTHAQTIYQYESDEAKFIFFDKSISQYVPHVIWEHSLGLERHDRLWNDTTRLNSINYKPEKTQLYLTDWNDDGNGGATPLPRNLVIVGMAPLNNTYNVAPSVERYRHLFSHELSHIYATDKYTKADLRWRKFFGTKVSVDSEAPVSALWSYLTVPRWYNPRWYQEGIAGFVETAMGGGVGRALGTYDEMSFRTIVESGRNLYSAVGLEAEGTSADFRVGGTSYLYGNRFVDYLAAQYGTDSLFDFYNREEGSKRFFASQFKHIYGKSFNDVWDEWKEYEAEHQKKNLNIISEYPLTELTPLYKKAMGSVCRPIYDSEKERIYLAANYQGDFAHISYIDLKTGREHILRKVDGPALYFTTYLTYDSRRNRLLYNIHNGDFRGIEVIDADTGKKLQRKTLQRVSNLTYNNVADCLYGIVSNGGVNSLVRYTPDLEKCEVLYVFQFGQTVSGLTVSDNGEKLLAQMTKPNGNDAIISFSVNGLNRADLRYEQIKEIDNVALIDFSFADNDSTIIGSSDFTGVQNLWSIDLKTKDMKLLSNVTTGLYAPIEYKADSLIALHYEADGLRPVKLARKEVKDANSITLLGQIAFEKNPQLDALTENSKAQESFSDIYNSITEYKPVKEMRFAGAYPDISGFRDVNAFNNVTPVLGYRIMFMDPLGLSSITLRIGTSAWSHNELRKKFHADLKWKLRQWTFNAAFNPSSFYDLAGPFQRSRAGYNIGFSYRKSISLFSPLSWSWGVGANTYGMMDALPLFQEIASPVSSMQTVNGEFSVSKTRSTLGAAMSESGYSANVSAYSYFAMVDGHYHAFPTLILQANKGCLLPVGNHNAFWLRSAAGQSFGDETSAFGNQYFGGFRNNYVDNSSVMRFREVNAFPGARIDEIAAHSFAKFIGELDFTPIRLNNFGSPGLYPSSITFQLFSTDLLANPWGSGEFKNYVNVGAQMNIEMVLFSYLKTTWSVGYAQFFGPGGARNNELMFSLKLL